jgi:hypothetical protein
MVEAHFDYALSVMIGSSNFIIFFFGLDLFVADYFDKLLLCV